jgi:hypothetical protein
MKYQQAVAFPKRGAKLAQARTDFGSGTFRVKSIGSTAFPILARLKITGSAVWGSSPAVQSLAENEGISARSDPMVEVIRVAVDQHFKLLEQNGPSNIDFHNETPKSSSPLLVGSTPGSRRNRLHRKHQM